MNVEYEEFSLPSDNAENVGQYLDCIAAKALDDDSGVERMPFPLFSFSTPAEEQTEGGSNLGLGLALTGLAGGAALFLAKLANG